MADEFKVEDEVVRVQGGPGYAGARGRVVETSGDRVRVFWHTPVSANQKSKRTWVAKKQLKPG